MSRKSYITPYCCAIIALLLVAIAACGGTSSSDSDSVCGNDQCETGESCSSCPQDCTTGCDHTSSCTDPVFVTSDINGVWSDGGYSVHNNMWNSSGYSVSETLYACAYNNWYVVADANDDSGDGAVKTYPNVHKDYADAPINSFDTLTSTFAADSPHAGIYNVAYDIWLNGVAEIGCTELMIWTENFNQVPAGSRAATVTLGGRTYDVWREPGSWQYVAFVPGAAMTSGTLDIKQMLDWMTVQGWITASATLDQICFGVEIVSTGGSDATFAVTDFSIDASPDGTDPVCAHPRPGPSNTGVPAGTLLTPSGSIEVTTDGAVIENLDVTGSITVLADNVTIRNVRITSNDYYPIRYFDNNNVGLLVEDSEIIGLSGNVTSAIAFEHYTARRLNIHGSADGLKADADVLIEDCWIHDLSNGPSEHNDGVQSAGGNGPVTIRHNDISGASNAAVQAGNGGSAATQDLTIQCNWLSGGGYTLNIRGTGQSGPANTRVIDNRFGRDAAYGPWTIDDPLAIVTGNVWDDDGSPIAYP